MSTSYEDFIRAKVARAAQNGLDIDATELHPILKPHQRDIVQWAIRGGQRAIFAAFGLGKSIMQLEICRQIHRKTGGKTLIICPLGVKQEFVRDAMMLDGMHVQFVRRPEEMDGGAHYITNYESVRDGKLDPNLFECVSLDEASVLRSYGSKTYQTFFGLFRDVRFRFVATATPSPNRHKELIHYGGFLGVMDTGHALTKFFIRDSEKAGNLQLNPHTKDEFWAWLHSWAIFLQKPSELGYSDEGYELPEMKVIYHEVGTGEIRSVDRDGQVIMFADGQTGLSEAAAIKRESIDVRVAEMKKIIDEDPDAHYILWHHQEAERHAIKKAIPAASEVYGSLDIEEREKRIIDFSDGHTKYLATKPSISGSGCNFQRHCHKCIFVGIDFDFNDFIQSIHRIYRFLQTEVCEIHIIHTDRERHVVSTLERKWADHDELMENMSKVIAEYGLNQLASERLERRMTVERVEKKGKYYDIALNDCVDEARRRETDSVGLIVTSIPFSNHYEYTPSYLDFGCTDDNTHFWAQMDYLSPELLRILSPGRIFACHVKDRILFGNVTGTGCPTSSPFHAEAIFHYMRHGFNYIGMITIVTDVVRENNQTYRLGWSEQCKDGSKMGVGSPEYVLLFRKPQTDKTKAYADVPVVKDKDEYTRPQWQIDAHAFWRDSGNTLFDPSDMGSTFTKRTRDKLYSYAGHVELGNALDKDLPHGLPSTFMAIAPGSHHPDVWDDITRMRTLNSEQARRDLEQHTCPLQLETVERLINRYSNKGDLVYDPFGGLMTVPYCAIRMGRRGGASELNPISFRDGARYCELAEQDRAAPTLFDALDIDGSREIA